MHPWETRRLESCVDCVNILFFQLLDFAELSELFCKLQDPLLPLHENSVSDSERSTVTDLSWVATDFLATFSILPSQYVSCSFTWELDAASDFEFLFHPAFRFPWNYEYPRFSWVTFRFSWSSFIAVDLDFPTILSSSFCFFILFVIALGQLIKLEFLAQ